MIQLIKYLYTNKFDTIFFDVMKILDIKFIEKYIKNAPNSIIEYHYKLKCNKYFKCHGIIKNYKEFFNDKVNTKITIGIYENESKKTMYLYEKLPILKGKYGFGISNYVFDIIPFTGKKIYKIPSFLIKNDCIIMESCNTAMGHKIYAKTNTKYLLAHFLKIYKIKNKKNSIKLDKNLFNRIINIAKYMKSKYNKFEIYDKYSDIKDMFKIDILSNYFNNTVNIKDFISVIDNIHY